MDKPSTSTIKVKSGAEKRKIKKEKEEKIRKLPKIDSFFSHRQPQKENEPLHEENKGSTDSDSDSTDEPKEIIPICADKSDKSRDKSVSDINKEDLFASCDKLKQETDILTSDLGHYQNKIITDDLRRLIISLPLSRPKGPFPKDSKQENRSFSESYYTSIATYGPIPRLWLCYSKITDAAYCFPCWLFSTDASQWRSGLRDWKHLSFRITKHSNSLSHIQSSNLLHLWKTNQTIDKEMEDKIRYETSFWKLVLERLFRITLVLAKNSLPFRGHREELSEDYNGNFLALVNLLASYDDVMKQVLTMPRGSIRYLSPTIQNELIQTLSSAVLQGLVSQICSAPFFSLLLDTTQDISKKDQLSIVVRTVHIVRNEIEQPLDFEIKETFLGLYELKQQTARGMSDSVLNILNDLNLSIKNCYGQGYDGANVMSGAYNGVQAKIKQIQPNAEYVHCASHNLNLVINDAVSGCSEVRLFFTTLQNIYIFFGMSIKRWDLLSSISGESEVTLKTLNPTRWSGRFQSILAIKLRFFDILKCLTEIQLKSQKREEKDEASSLKKKIATFEFIFLTVFLFKVMNEINLASKVLQKQNVDLDSAAEVLERVKNKIAVLRNSYDEIKLEAQNLANTWDINPNFTSKRQPKIKKHSDELASDFRFENREYFFKVNVFYFVLDQICGQIDKRFASMQTLTKYFDFLEPKTLLKRSEAEVIKNCDNLCKKYPEIISPKFTNQFIQIVNLTKDDIKDTMSIGNFFQLIINKYGVMESDFSEVYSAFLLFLTLPVTVASVERSFSKLKIIKNYLRSTTGQNRLCNLALLSIEHKFASSLDLRDIVNNFANAKARKKMF